MLRWLRDLFSTLLNDKPLSFNLSIPIKQTLYMKLMLKRIEDTDYGLFGQLSTDGFNCVTLERHDINIPCGTYKVALYTSPVHGLIPLLHGVPGRSMIEIHEGNYEHNSKGCILVGSSRRDIDGDGRDDIAESKATLKKLVGLLVKQVDIDIQIV